MASNSVLWGTCDDGHEDLVRHWRLEAQVLQMIDVRSSTLDPSSELWREHWWKEGSGRG